MLNQYSKESLDRAKKRTMNHNRAMWLIVFANVLKLKPFRQIEVPLHSPKLPQSANGVLDLNVNLGPVKGGFAFNSLILDRSIVKCASERNFSFRPVFVCAQVLLC